MTAFHRTIAPQDIPPEGLTLALEADADILDALRRRLDLRGLTRLAATLYLKRDGKAVRVDGAFEADAVRECAVTLQDFDVGIAEPIHILYLADPGDADAEGIAIDPESEEDVEPLPDGGIDPGEIVAQSLSLALDPFPRAPGVGGVDPEQLPSDDDPADASPFAILKKLGNKA